MVLFFQTTRWLRQSSLPAVVTRQNRMLELCQLTCLQMFDDGGGYGWIKPMGALCSLPLRDPAV